MTRFQFCLGFVIFVLFIGMFIFPTILAEPVFFFKFGSFGLDDDELNEPTGIALDSSGKTIYIADKNNNRINVFDDDGIDEFNFGSFCDMSTNQGCHDNAPKADVDGDGQFNQPSDVVFDAFGDIYVADSENNRIQRFDSDGDFEIKFGSSDNGEQDYLGSPTAIAVQKSTRDIYVTDTETNSISVFGSSGNFLFKFGSTGSNEGEFRNPTDIIIDNTDILYVADTDNDRIQIFELVDSNNCPQGTNEIVDGVCFVNEFGSTGSDDGEFNSPSGLALDPTDDLLYVADTDNDRIQIFELVDSNNCPQGTDEIVDGVCFVNEFGSTGSDDGEFNSPSGLVLDDVNDLLYVSDTNNDRIQVFLTLDVSDKIPDRPTNLDASAASPTSIVLTWDTPETNDQIPEITGYKIEFKKGTDSFKTLVADTKNPNTHFLHEGLSDETYTYQVYAINSEGIGNPSVQASAKPQHTTVPAGLVATAISPNQIRLSWNAPSQTFGQTISDYTIKREIVSGVYEEIATVDDKFTTHVVSNLATGKTYTYVVVANYPLGSSDVSNSASATPQEDSKDQSSFPSVTLPTAPQQLTATATSNQIKLSWILPSSDGNSPITGYKIETKKDNGAFSVVIEDTKSTARTYTHTSVSPDTTYTYRVSAINSVGVSPPSNVATANLSEVSLEIKPLGTFRIDEEKTLSFTVGVTDPSLTNLQFSLEKGYPSGATINANNGKFTWTPTKSQAPGPYIFDIVVRQGTLEDSQSVTIYVNDVPDKTEPVSKIASFVDPSQDPQHYIDRYNNEPTYKEWFDSNFPDRTIYEAVGLENPISKPEPKQEPPKQPTSKIASFVDPKKDPQDYVDRYNNEPTYKDWFDRNFPEYSSIYEAVGLKEPESRNVLPFVDPNQDPDYYIDRYNTDLTYRDWFDKNYPEYSIYEAVGLETPMGFCGEGTTLVDGVCEVEHGYVQPKQKSCFLFWCW